jgi:hypothetical protein
VPVADEVERLVAAELLVAGMEVDRGVAEVTAAVVEVPPVDVHPDAADRVDELAEAAEVDGDQVVDREPRQLPDRLERALRAALGVRAVDAGVEARRPGADDLDVEVAREREQRDRLRLGVGAHEHDGVGPGGDAVLAGALVVADDEGGGRLARQRDVEALRGDLHVRCRGDDRSDALVEPEVGAAGDRADDDEDRDQHPREDGPQPGPARARRRLRLAVDRDRREGPGGEHGPSVPGHGRPAANASLQRRPHTQDAGARAPAKRSG